MNFFNSKILSEEIQTYIRQHEHSDFRQISLQKSPFPEVSSAELAQQIKGLQVARNKFPFFYKVEGIFYTPSLNLEQASSWATAHYKSKLFSGKSLIDLTAGMGIDAFAFAQEFENVTALERNEDLAEISKHNYKVLNQNNLEYIPTDFESYFDKYPHAKWDVIYLDPARRKGSEKKFLLQDLEPDLLEWIDEFLNRAEMVLIKLSPLLDLKSVREKISQIHESQIVAVKNEVKELLLLCRNEVCDNPLLKAVNLESGQPDFELKWDEESQVNSAFSEAGRFIYEPNAAVLKSGAFKLVGERFGLKKLQQNTHLYTSEKIINSFPGKVFEVLEEIKNPKKEIEKGSFHVISKNYPVTVESIRKKYKLKESENQTLIFTQSISGKHILLCKRVL